MGKKKNESHVSISIAEMAKQAPKQNLLPNNPTQGQMLSNSRQFGTNSSNERKFYRNYQYENRSNFSRTNRSYSSRPKIDKVTCNFSSLNISSKPQQRSSTISSAFKSTPQTNSSTRAVDANALSSWTPKKKPVGEVTPPFRVIDSPKTTGDPIRSKERMVSKEWNPKKTVERSKTTFNRLLSHDSEPKTGDRKSKGIGNQNRNDFKREPNKLDWKSIAISSKKDERKIKMSGKSDVLSRKTEKTEENGDKKIEKELKENEKSVEPISPKKQPKTQKKKLDFFAIHSAKKREREKQKESALKTPEKYSSTNLAQIVKDNAEKTKNDLRPNVKPERIGKLKGQRATDLWERKARKGPRGGDVLQDLKEKRLREEEERKAEEEKKGIAKKERDLKNDIKRVRNLLVSKQRENVEFFGYFKGSNDSIDLRLWILALENVYEKPFGHLTLNDEFEKLTVWTLRTNVISLSELREHISSFSSGDSQKMKKTLTKVLRLYSELYSPKDLQTLFTAQSVDLAAFFQLEEGADVKRFLGEERLTFLLPSESILPGVIRMIDDDVSPGELATSLRGNKAQLNKEPEVARAVGIFAFKKIASLATGEKLSSAVIEKSYEGDVPEDVEDDVDFFALENRIEPEIAAIFEAFLNLFVLLGDCSLAHQREILNAWALEWKRQKGSKETGISVVKILYLMRVITYEGFTEWRYWVPDKKEETLIGSRRKLLTSCIDFLDGALEKVRNQMMTLEEELSSE